MEVDRRIEEREGKDEYEVRYIVPGTSREGVLDPCSNIAGVLDEHRNDDVRYCQDGHCEDYRHNAGHINLERQIVPVAAALVSSDDLL